jgi:hypothetical protein
VRFSRRFSSTEGLQASLCWGFGGFNAHCLLIAESERRRMDITSGDVDRATAGSVDLARQLIFKVAVLRRIHRLRSLVRISRAIVHQCPHSVIRACSQRLLDPAAACQDRKREQLLDGALRRGSDRLSQSAPSRLSPIVATVATVQALWVGIATVRSSLDDIENTPKQSAILAKARQICGIGQQDVVLADEPGFEFSLNNRVIATPYQFTHLVRSGMFPVEIWQNDLIRPDVRCLVVHTDILERPLSAVDIQTDLFPPRIREVLSQRFVLAAQDGGMHVYKLRNGTQSDSPKN